MRAPSPAAYRLFVSDLPTAGLKGTNVFYPVPCALSCNLDFCIILKH